MNHAVIGARGEVGAAYCSILRRKANVWEKDAGGLSLPEFPVDVMHVALNFHAIGAEKFAAIVNGYARQLKPQIISILSTATPGVTESFGPSAVHSTTRGLHPNLESGILKIVKHVGGPKAEVLAQEFERFGIKCITHKSPRTTELAHILSNSSYGVSLMFADEMAKICRHYGVDYVEAVIKYGQTHNEGYAELDHPRLVRPVLMPPGGRIGGHCVSQGASLIPQEIRGEMLGKLAEFNRG